MDGASFGGKLDAESLQAGGDLFMRDAQCAIESSCSSRMSAAILICAAPP
jgi:hypothetical protein